MSDALRAAAEQALKWMEGQGKATFANGGMPAVDVLNERIRELRAALATPIVTGTSDNDEHLAMVADCEEREGKLTDWERGFIDSARRVLEQGFSLSREQAKKLDEIWEKVT